MHNFLNSSKRRAFTLLEVMISVILVSVVILTLFQMKGNSNLIFLQISNGFNTNQYLSFFTGQKDFGFQNKQTSIKNLVTEFDIDHELRKELSETKINIRYTKLETMDMKDYEKSSEMIFEIGSTNIKINDSSASIVRIKLQ